MAKEIQALLPSGLTLYAVVINSVGQIWNTAGTPAFEAYNGANWTDYDIALTEAGAGIYTANMPAAAAGSYSYAVYEQAGASPATTDALKGSGYLEWGGSAVIVPGDVLSISGDSAAADNLEAMLDGTGGVDLDLKQLHLTGAAGPGLLITSSAVGGGAVKIQSTAVVSGIGIDIDASGGGSIGIDIDAVGTGASLAASASDGIGLNIAGGSGSGAGLGASGYSGINAIGTVNDIIGDITGNLSGSVGSLSTQAKADVNTEIVDALNVDTYAEPGQGAPGATISLAAKIGYVYKSWRNKKTQTSDTRSIFNDAGDTVDQKATDSDNGTTYTKGEIGSGP